MRYIVDYIVYCIAYFIRYYDMHIVCQSTYSVLFDVALIDIGQVLSFEGGLYHGGEPLISGTRYIIAAFLLLDRSCDSIPRSVADTVEAREEFLTSLLECSTVPMGEVTKVLQASSLHPNQSNGELEGGGKRASLGLGQSLPGTGGDSSGGSFSFSFGDV